MPLWLLSQLSTACPGLGELDSQVQDTQNFEAEFIPAPSHQTSIAYYGLAWTDATIGCLIHTCALGLMTKGQG